MTPRWYWPMVCALGLIECVAMGWFCPPPNGWHAEIGSVIQKPDFSLMRQAERHEQARIMGEQIKRQQEQMRKQQAMHCTSLPGESLHCE